MKGFLQLCGTVVFALVLFVAIVERYSTTPKAPPRQCSRHPPHYQESTDADCRVPVPRAPPEEQPGRFRDQSSIEYSKAVPRTLKAPRRPV